VGVILFHSEKVMIEQANLLLCCALQQNIICFTKQYMFAFITPKDTFFSMRIWLLES